MGTTAQKLEYLNTTKGYIKDSINLTGANITTEPFRNYAVILKDTLASLLKDPTPIWTNFPKVEATGTSFTISTYDSLFEMKLSGDTAQSGTPAPDNEVPVQTVSGRQVINVNSNAYNIDLTGKNLLNETAYQNGYTANGITYSLNNDGSFNFVGTASANTTFILLQNLELEANTNYYLYSSQEYNSNTYNISIRITDGNNNYQYITPTGVKKTPSVINGARFNIFFASGSQINIIGAKAMLIKSDSVVDTYSSYYNPIELCKIGTYQDYIYKNSGKWYVHKETGKYTCTGSEDWGLTQPNEFRINIADQKYQKYGYGFCNYYIRASERGIDKTIIFGIDGRQIFIKDTSCSTTTDFKTWLSTHNTIVYYIIDTATDTEITNSDLINQLDSVALATGTNVITVSGTLPAILYIKALQN